MNRKGGILKKLRSFSLITSLTIPECLEKLDGHLDLSGDERLKHEYSIQNVNHEKTTEGFCIVVSDNWISFFGAKAVGYFYRTDDATIIYGKIHNLYWQYLFYPPPILVIIIVLLSVAENPTATSPERLAFFLLVPALILGGYLYQARKYRDALITTIAENLDARPCSD